MSGAGDTGAGPAQRPPGRPGTTPPDRPASGAPAPPAGSAPRPAAPPPTNQPPAGPPSPPATEQRRPGGQPPRPGQQQGQQPGQQKGPPQGQQQGQQPAPPRQPGQPPKPGGRPGPTPPSDARPDTHPPGQPPPDSDGPPKSDTSLRWRPGWIDRFSLRTRLGLIAAVGVGFLVALVSVTAYLTVSTNLRAQADADLINRAYAAANSSLGDPSVLTQIPSEALGAADVQIQLLAGVNSPGGPDAISRGHGPQPGAPELAVARGEEQVSTRTVRADDGQSYRMVAVPASENSQVALILSQSTAGTEALQKRLGLVLLLVGGGGVILAAWAGVGIARAGLRPVGRLTAAAEHVARTTELRAVPVAGDDELARLARSFNAMLQALAEAQARERRLIADAGHELRTPLTSLRTNLDLLAQSDGQPGLSDEDRQALLRDVRAQVAELSTLVGDLVELSREDSPRASQAPLDLADIVAQALTRARPRAASVEFQTDITSWPTVGDAQSLERAVTNLLDNAAKWSPAGGVVRVSLHDGVLKVADEGPGISENDLDRVFERFYRSSEARTMPGSGLGLSIVKQVAERHGGWVRAERTPTGGALMTMAVPRVPTGATS